MPGPPQRLGGSPPASFSPSPTRPPSPSPGRTLAAAILLTTSLGSIHAFSVFIAPLESLYQTERADISLIYAGALLSLTAAVLLGSRLYDRIRPAWLAAAACLLAALGLAISALAPSLPVLALGYSLLFGAANGIGYGFSLQAVHRAMPRRKGLAMSVVTATYAVGAAAFAQILASLVTSQGLTAALLTLAAVLVVVALASAALLRQTAPKPPGAGAAAGTSANASGATPTRALPHRRDLLLLWAGYGCGTTAGLMAIGHAAGIVAATTSTQDAGDMGVRGAILIGVGNALGGFVMAGLADRWPMRRLLVLLPLLSALVLAGLALTKATTLVVAGLAAVGFCYGAIIAAYPVATANRYGPDLAARAYGRVFIAWGLAGLGGPWIAGLIFDAGQSYTPALALAAAAALLSAGLAACLSPSVDGARTTGVDL